MFEFLSFMPIQGSYPEKPLIYSIVMQGSLLPDLTNLSRTQFLRPSKEAKKKAYLLSSL